MYTFHPRPIISPNVIKIIGGIVALNKIHGTSLGLNEMKYCYSLTRRTYGFSLKRRSGAPSFGYLIPKKDPARMTL